MIRLLRFLPIVVPMVARFIKSPRGQRLVAGVRTKLGAKAAGTTTDGR